MNFLEIEKVVGREILDSKGNPTVEAEVTLVDGTVGRGTAPMGTSVWVGHTGTERRRQGPLSWQGC